MIQEIYRVLRPGGRFITFSLHPITEILHYYNNTPNINMKVNSYHIKNNRWNSTHNSARSISHTLIVCDKVKDETSPNCTPEYPLQLHGVLTDEEYAQLCQIRIKVYLILKIYLLI